MDQVLARSDGNAIEVREAVEYLRGDFRDDALHEVTMALCAEMLCSAKLAENTEQALAKLQAALDDGSALDKFAKMVHALGGPADFVENMDTYLPKAPLVKPLLSPESGYISDIKTRELGLAVVQLGGGRSRADQKIDHAVGLDKILKPGEKITQGEPLLYVHVQNEKQFDDVKSNLLNAFSISKVAPESLPAVYEVIR